jgi:hypothetical protein
MLVGIGLVAAFGVGTAQADKTDERVKVEIHLATEHVPKDLKAGTRVDLKMVKSKTVGPRGRTTYSTSPVAENVEVASVVQVEKPANPEGAVRVQLLVVKDKAEKIKKTRDHMVTVVERQKDGGVVRKKKPITLRLELTKPVKK